MKVKKNNLKIGDEIVKYVNDLKYTYIKVSYSSYVLKQKFLYEKYIGKIPNGYQVIFLDSNRDNFNLDNLFLVSNNVYYYMRQNHLFFNNKLLTKTFIINTELRLKYLKLCKEM